MKRPAGGKRTREGGTHPITGEHHTQEGGHAADHGGVQESTQGEGVGDGVGEAVHVQPHRSGAPEAGGATSRGSSFGGRSWQAGMLRAVARVARSIEAEAYRRLRDLDGAAPQPSGFGGRPHRVRDAFHERSRST